MGRTKKTVCSPSLTKSSKASNTKSNNDKDLTSSLNEAIDQPESGKSASNIEPEPSANDTNLKSCWVWNHFLQIESKPGKAVCNHCKKLMTISVSSMKYHLNVKHRQKIHEDQPKITDYRTMTKEKKLKLDTAIANFIVQDLHAVNVVMGKDFRNWMKVAVGQQYHVPHRTTFSRYRIPKMYEACKLAVIEEYKPVEFVCCTTDMWVDNFKHLAYMTLTAHVLCLYVNFVSHDKPRSQ